MNLFSNPTLIGLQVRLDRPVDRERPCCKNICTLGAAKGPHAGELICADCGCHRGWLSKSTARWIEHVITRFGAPTTPIVVRKSHTYQPTLNSNINLLQLGAKGRQLPCVALTFSKVSSSSPPT